MQAQTEPLAANRQPYGLKASILRGYVTVLERRGELTSVLSAVSPTTRAMMLQPPLASTWIDPAVIDEIMDVIEARGGLPAVKALAYAGLNLGVVPIIRPIIQGLFRVFGTNPGTLFRKVDLMIAATLRGVAFRYTESGPRSGTLEADIYGPVLRMSRFYRFLAAFELMGEVSGTRVRVSEPKVVTTGPWGSRARYDISW